MKAGNITQTVWKRSISRQLNCAEREDGFRLSPEESRSALYVGDSADAVWSTASAAGFSSETGEYALLKVVNDLAAGGAVPKGVSIQAMLPLDTEEDWLKEMTVKLAALCNRMKIDLTCVKAEVIPGFVRPMVFITGMGVAPRGRLLCAGNALPGQDIVLCGYIGLEGTLRILADSKGELEQRFVPSFIRQTESLKKNLDASDFIFAAAQMGILAMHQAGSGGIFAALWELAEASGIGLEIELPRLSIRQETVEICEYYNLNPYQLISGGCILMAAKDGDALVGTLQRMGARARKLGVATDKKDRVITSDEEKRYLERPAPDELVRWQEQRLAVHAKEAIDSKEPKGVNSDMPLGYDM